MHDDKNVTAPHDVQNPLERMAALGHKMFWISSQPHPENIRTEYRCRGCFKGVREYTNNSNDEHVWFIDNELEDQCTGKQLNVLLYKGL